MGWFSSDEWGRLFPGSCAVICSAWTCLCAVCWAACLIQGSSKAQERPWSSSLLRCRCWCSCWAGWVGSLPGSGLVPWAWALSAPAPPAAARCRKTPHLPCCSHLYVGAWSCWESEWILCCPQCFSPWTSLWCSWSVWGPRCDPLYPLPPQVWAAPYAPYGWTCHPLS